MTTKQFLTALKIKCLNCDNTNNLDFHHVMPQYKRYSISNTLYKKLCFSILTEIDKCIVLCRKCHKRLDFIVSQEIALELKNISLLVVKSEIKTTLEALS